MRSIVLGIVVAAATNVVNAYEIDTHSRITYEAYFRSTAKASVTLRRLGLSKSRASTFNASAGEIDYRFHIGPKYYDPVKTNGPDRYATDYDRLNSWVMKAYKASQPQRRWTYSAFDGRDEPYFPVDWMRRGAIYGMIAV